MFIALLSKQVTLQVSLKNLYKSHYKIEEIRYRVLPIQNSEYKNGYPGPDGILSAPVSHQQ